MEMTRQEVFDTVAAHLLKQNARSLIDPTDLDDPGCAYRGAAGLKCAVGCLIPDEVYKPSMEGIGMLGLLEAGAKWAPKLAYLHPHRFLLADLQRVHDGDAPAEWPTQLARVAREYSLTFTPPTPEVTP
jgi:hypothetical protein